jgi:hypothetical protein
MFSAAPGLPKTFASGTVGNLIMGNYLNSIPSRVTDVARRLQPHLAEANTSAVSLRRQVHSGTETKELLHGNVWCTSREERRPRPCAQISGTLALAGMHVKAVTFEGATEMGVMA